MSASASGSRLQERKWIDADGLRDSLNALERQIALATLDTAEVGAVNAHLVGERFL